MAAPFDLDLLRTFANVVDCGGFTRAAERLNRTQSTISQQIKRLEDQIGQDLLSRQARQIHLTDAGEVLLGYARRMLALQDEARARLLTTGSAEIIRLGLPEDFAGRQLPAILAAFARAHPHIRLDIRCDLSAVLRQDFASGQLDVALFKTEIPASGALRCWNEPLVWAGPAQGPMPALTPLPLALFPAGCLFRQLILNQLDQLQHPWRIAYVSPSLAGIQAVVASGLAIALIGRSGLSAEMVALDHQALGLPILPSVWFSLMVRPGSNARDQLACVVGDTVDAFAAQDVAEAAQ